MERKSRSHLSLSLFPKCRFFFKEHTVLEKLFLLQWSSIAFHYTLRPVHKRFVEAALMRRNRHCDASRRSISLFYFLVCFQHLDLDT